jgi:hypothetical protein
VAVAFFVDKQRLTEEAHALTTKMQLAQNNCKRKARLPPK